jgi:integrase
MIAGDVVPLATTHGTLVLPGLGKHEGAKSGKLIYFDSDSTPLLLGAPFFRPDGMVKRSARKAGINVAVSSHCLRHAHGSHAIDRGASLPEVQSTLGHCKIARTSGHLHARLNTSSGLHLDPGVFVR